MRIWEFLRSVGTKFKPTGAEFAKGVSERECLKDIEEIMSGTSYYWNVMAAQARKRHGHSSRWGSLIVRHNEAKYLNKHS